MLWSVYSLFSYVAPECFVTPLIGLSSAVEKLRGGSLSDPSYAASLLVLISTPSGRVAPRFWLISNLLKITLHAIPAQYCKMKCHFKSNYIPIP